MAKPNPVYIPRDQLSEEQLAAALKTCAQEPIHIPNLIQPHGALIVADPESGIICQVSENIAAFIGAQPEDAIGKNITDFFSAEEIKKIILSVRTHDLQPVKSFSLSVGDRNYTAAVHISQGYRVIELENSGETAGEKYSLDTLSDMMRDYAVDVHNIKDTQHLYDLLVTTIRDLTGFDRVKLYRFDEDWNGAIVAQAKADFMPDYLGLNFPASDIPEQARKLYAKSYLRLIPDIRYKPVPLYPAKTPGNLGPIDLSYAILRSVSPIHIQYLDNINVEGSMSISVMQNGELWGLVACHHASPHWIPYNRRVLAESMTHIFSAKLSSIMTRDEQFRANQQNSLLKKLSASGTDTANTYDILFQNKDIAMDALAAQGLAIRTGKNMYSFGETPDPATLSVLFDWYQKNYDNEIIYTRDTPTFMKGKNGPENISGGFLVVPIGQTPGDSAIWFRNEIAREVSWGGNPEKPFEQTKAGYRLTPRASFELWKTTIKGKSEIWSDSDIATARSITQIIIENEKIHAERSNSAKTEFLSSMSHELRTPIGAVIGIVEIFKRDATLTPRQKTLISTLGISAASLLNLINDLLDIAKIEANQIQFETVDFTASSLLEDIRSLMQIQAREKKLALNINYDLSSDVIFSGDVGKIKQVLINLVGNAIKFTEKGYINLSLFTEEKEAGITEMNLEVSDSGIGIAQDKLDAIFEKFTQADSSITRKFGGTGLGLFITKTIVESMGGKIEVKSKTGMGSRFLVSLPLPSRHAQTQGGIIESEPLAGTNRQVKKILLVEDRENNILVANFFLDERGFDVTVVNNGLEALDILKHEYFDLVIMDIQMPVMDGLTATRAIREREADLGLPRLPIMAMTANALKEDRQACFDAGMDEYVSKPIKIDEMNRKIDQLLGLERAEI